ncbi:hypothetical protein ACGFXB_18475 [Streptomyces canus]|uniref:hypothetical protein n=1 Tax=Streptomyces canus TaxID=58343 RepID=UPI00371FD690
MALSDLAADSNEPPAVSFLVTAACGDRAVACDSSMFGVLLAAVPVQVAKAHGKAHTAHLVAGLKTGGDGTPLGEAVRDVCDTSTP